MVPTATVHMAVTEVDGQPAQLVWDTPPDLDPPVPRRVAAALGLRPYRELLQLRRSLLHPRRPTGAGERAAPSSAA
ncbi:MAG: hypothetical protein R2701_07275 [Acidimicrobiales bacterium]